MTPILPRAALHAEYPFPRASYGRDYAATWWRARSRGERIWDAHPSRRLRRGGA